MSNPSDNWPKWAIEEVVLADANPKWQETGDRMIADLEVLLYPHGVIRFEHVGSTSVPGLPAKPIIDLMAQVSSYDNLLDIIETLSPDGWNYVPPELDGQPYRRFFVKVDNDRRAAHLHLFVAGEPRFEEQLAFREALLERREWAMAYGELKIMLSDRYKIDREAYTHAKSEFVEKVLKKWKNKETDL